MPENKTSFTPGPLHLEHELPSAIPVSIGICAGDPNGNPDDINVLGYALCEIGTAEENLANARLWAAAPDLYAACKALLNWPSPNTAEGIEDQQAITAAARAALAKAQGK